MSYQRPHAATLAERMAEPRRHLQVVAGPRQVGKTTLVQQVVEAADLPVRSASADEPTLRGPEWIEQQWQAARLSSAEAETSGAVLVLTDGKIYQVDHYNLDVIISVGYRVKSPHGTQFRIWATRTLREHLVRDYILNRQRFAHNVSELEAALALVRKAAAGEALTTDQGRGLVDIIARYTQTFLLLQRYDEGLLAEPKSIPSGVLPTVDEARAAVVRLKAELLGRGEANDLFGRECAAGLAVLLGNLD